MVALVYMTVSFLMTRSEDSRRTRDIPDSTGTIIRDILRIAIPITLSSSMVGIVNVIDASLVQGQLQRVLLENPDSWTMYVNFVDFAPLESALNAWKETLAGAPATMAALSAQVDQELAAQVAQSAAQELHTTLESLSRTLYGNYYGALNIYNLPASLMTAITASVIPAVSGALARRDKRGASRVAGSSLRITALLACPMGVGLLVLGEPIIRLLYPKLEAGLAGPLLSALGVAAVFVCLMLVCNSIIQAYGFVNVPILVMVGGGVVKIFANYNAVAMPRVGIYGAPLGNILCFGLCLLLDLIIIARAVPRHPRYLDVFLKPMIASAAMGAAAWAVYGLASKVLSSVPEGETEAVLSRAGSVISVMGAIGVAMAVYFGLVIALRAIYRDDLSLMPKGDKIARLLHL